MRIALQQPYFIPYAGYFRLMSCVDLFVIYDDCQFPYPGYVHRNRLWDNRNSWEWLSINLKSMPLKTTIKELQFSEDFKKRWENKIPHYKIFRDHPTHVLVEEVIKAPNYKSPLDFVTSLLTMTCNGLGIKTEIISSSTLKADEKLKGQDRVIEICKHFKAKEYVNAPGGVKIYQPEEFKKHDIDLKFLTSYANKESILERLVNEKPKDVRKEVDDNAKFQN